MKATRFATNKKVLSEAGESVERFIKSGVTDWKGVEDYFAGGDDESIDDFRGWLKVSWSKPTGAELDAVEQEKRSLFPYDLK